MIDDGRSSLTVASHGIDQILEGVRNFWLDKEVAKALPKFITVRSFMDPAYVCSLKVTTHGVEHIKGEDEPCPVPPGVDVSNAWAIKQVPKTFFVKRQFEIKKEWSKHSKDHWAK